MRCYLPLLLLVGGCLKPVPAPPANLDTVEAVAQDTWEVLMAESPLWATQLGDRRFDAVLPNVSARQHQDTLRKKEELQFRLNGLNAGYLQGESLLTARVLAVLLRDEIDTAVCESDLWAFDQLGGYHLALADLATYQRVDSPSAATAYLSRLNVVGTLFDQHIDNLRQGMGKKLTTPRIIVQRVVEQLHDLVNAPAAESPYLAVLGRADALSPSERQQLRADIIAATTSSVQPALRKYLTFLEKEYLPHARATVGLSEVTNGEACYRALTSQHGGRISTPDAWHATGMTELERLHTEMALIAKAEGYATADAYAQALSANAQQHTSDPTVLVTRAAAVVKRAESVLPKAFAGFAQVPVEVRAVEAFREKAAPAGFYEPAAPDGAHPAVFYINTYKPQTRHLYNLEALTFHEAIPGHHLQFTAAQALVNLPQVRRHVGPDAYVEGWGLYAELLADELGLYSTPAARFGMLNFQAWRAARFVVDSGIHAMGWSREQAIDFMRRNLYLPEQDIVNEVDRYIAWPGQALAYLSGRMELQTLRSQAQRKQGDNFDLAAFHHAVLSHGALPLPVLRDMLGVWINTAPAG